MKKYMFFIAVSFLFIPQGYAQREGDGPGIPHIEIKKGVTYPDNIFDPYSLIFEGQILADSVVQTKRGNRIYQKVLVLKQFKGVFTTDTLTNLRIIDGMAKHRDSYAHVGDEAVFFVEAIRPEMNIPPNIVPYVLYGDNSGFFRVCDKPDAAKEVYERIEKITGQKYIEVHPNNCQTK